MSLDQIPLFWAKVADDAELQSRVADVPEDGRAEALSAMAGEKGLDCRAEDFKAFEEVLRFWDRLQKDEELQSRLEKAATMDSDTAAGEVTRIAGDAGFEFSAEQLSVATDALLEGLPTGSGERLTDEDLDLVAGGAQGSLQQLRHLNQMSQVNQVGQLMQKFRVSQAFRGK